MQIHFWGTDFGPLVFGQILLKQNPAQDLVFYCSQSKQIDSENKKFTEIDFWKISLDLVPENEIIAILHDRKNKNINKISSNKNHIFFPTQVIYEMANEGLSDTVEFRRLLRKSIRQVKNHNIRTIFFPEVIFGDGKTKKIIQHIAGSQIKILTPVDGFEAYLKSEKIKPSEKQNITIYSDDDLEFTHARAENILRMKLKKEVILCKIP